ncbi:hypothetical protein D3C72_1863190 [compost metagenome]
MLLLNRCLALPEQARVGVIFAKRRATLADFCPFDAFLIRLKSSPFRGRRRFTRPVVVDRVGFIIRRIGIDILPVHPVALEIMVRTGWAIDRDFVEVWPAETADLRIGIREQTALQERIVGEVQSRNNMTRVERHLFVFGKEIVGVAVEHHFADQLYRNQLFRDEFGGVQQVKIKFELILFRNQL